MASSQPYVADAAPSVGPTGASTNRLVVLEVSANPSSKLLRTLDTSSNIQITIALCDEWADTDVSPSDIVRVIHTNPDGSYHPYHAPLTAPEHPILVTRDVNLLVHHPDTLVTGTAVAESFLCLRKSVLVGRVPQQNLSNSAGGEAALFGSMIHDLFQRILVLDADARLSAASLDLMDAYEAIEDLLVAYLPSLFAVSVSEKLARLVLHKVIPDLLAWHAAFLGEPGAPPPGADVHAGKHVHNLAVTAVHDIEELIWSPVLGLKGKVDASVRLRRDGADAGVAALELKTGSSQGYSAVSHTAQVSLYSLLMSDRYSGHVDLALLTYVRYQQALAAVRDDTANTEAVTLRKTTSNFDNGPRHKAVSAQRGELVGLVMQRNRLAAHLRLGMPVDVLPPPLKNSEQLCAKCFASDSCLVQYTLLEGGSEEGAADGPGAELFRNKAAHLSKDHAAYYRFWREVLAAEEEHAGRGQREIWSMRGSQRESLGRCVANLRLVVDEATSDCPHELLTPGQRTMAEFRRHGFGQPQGDFTTLGVSVNDYVVVSAEFRKTQRQVPEKHLLSTETWQSGLTNGFVHSVSSDSLVVSVDRSLSAWARHQGVAVDDISWRVDAEEIYASHSTAKRTVESLFLAEEANSFPRLRGLVVDLMAPRFEDSEESKSVTGSEALAEFGLNLNEDQEQALELSLRAKDYLLILGMPGTGKTTTLCAIVLAAAKQGKSILLCSHTNAAVDNVLLRLLGMDFSDFIRLGRNIEVIESRVHPFHVSKHMTVGKSVEQLEKDLDGPRVVATTCLGINHPLLVRRNKFDLVVIDEASQILQPICIGPLQYASGPFILVGDHYQLPPLLRAKHENAGPSVINSNDTKLSLEETHLLIESASESNSATTESLFRRLCEAHPESMVSLSKQYRMAAEIMHLSNELVYCGSLSCGSASVASQKLDISIGGLRNLAPWLKAVRNPARRVLFLDIPDREEPVVDTSNMCDDPGATSDVAKLHRKSEQVSRDNETEADIVVAAVRSLVQGGMKAEHITVLSPFRAQVHLIEDRLRNAVVPEGVCIAGVDVFTVDRYQGKDNNCVIVSFVRNGSTSVGPLLKDWRRMNVAVTRAKQKLILVGSAHTISRGGRFLGRMVSYMNERKLVVPVT